MHALKIAGLRDEGIVVSDTLRFVRRTDRIRLIGRLRTRSGGVLDVRKVLRPVGRADEANPRVLAVQYRYQALWQADDAGPSVRLFRYDNYHEDLSTLHRHDFDANGAETARYAVPHDRLPFLDEVIRETEALARLRARVA